jgi:hypothetical protein
VVRDFRGQVLGLDGHRRQDVGERSGFHSQSFFHFLGRFSAEQHPVSLASDPSYSLSVHSSLIGEPLEFLLGGREFFPSVQPFVIEDFLLDDFLFSGLDREIGLGKGDFLFSRVTVLGYEVAGVSGKMIIRNVLNGSFSSNYRFADVSKVIFC